MPIYLSDRDVTDLLTMDIALEAVEEGFRLQATGGAFNTPRIHTPLPNGELSVMSAAVPAMGVMGVKTFGLLGGVLSAFYLYLYDAETGELLAIVEANEKGRIRTGAATGVATRHMARPDAASVGIIGAGYQAFTQPEAVCRVRNITAVKVFCRTPARRGALAEQARARLGIDARAVRTAEECVRGADVVVTITTASEPVLKGEWLNPGAHVNAAGSHHPDRREIDEDAVRRATVVVADDVAQARLECGDLAYAVERGALRWDQVRGLAEIVAGTAPGRNGPDDITLFESQGIAVEDVAVGARLFEIARERGAGRKLPM